MKKKERKQIIRKLLSVTKQITKESLSLENIYQHLQDPHHLSSERNNKVRRLHDSEDTETWLKLSAYATAKAINTGW
jgi:hypothetical protein